MPYRFLKWLAPLILLICGIFLYSSGRNYSFYGFICIALAGITVCYILFHMLRQRHRTAARVLTAVFTAVLALGIAIVTVTGVLIGRAARGNAEESCSYIIVLGAKVNGTSPSRTLNERIHAAYDYLSAHPDTVAVVSGGQGNDEGTSEARCMFDALTAMGISPQRILIEDRASSTWENLSFSLALIEAEAGSLPQKIGLVSSDYHLFRARFFAVVHGADTVGIPAKTENPVHFLNYFLREIAGVWHYLILGG